MLAALYFAVVGVFTIHLTNSFTHPASAAFLTTVLAVFAVFTGAATLGPGTGGFYTDFAATVLSEQILWRMASHAGT